MNKLNKSEVSTRVNIFTFVLADWVTESSEALKLVRQYALNKNQLLYEYLIEKGIVKKHVADHNIVVTAGRTVLARLLSGDNTYSGEINYGALGDGSPDVSNSRTTLVNEVYRKVASSQAYDNNIVYVDFFYAAGDTNGTYTEFGNFIDGTGSADTGQLFSYIATGGWTKSGSESLFISCQYTIT